MVHLFLKFKKKTFIKWQLLQYKTIFTSYYLFQKMFYKFRLLLEIWNLLYCKKLFIKISRIHGKNIVYYI